MGFIIITVSTVGLIKSDQQIIDKERRKKKKKKKKKIPFSLLAKLIDFTMQTR